MVDWKGDWGFDAEVNREVRDAIQPFLIANETKSLLPFSAEMCETWSYDLDRLRDDLGSTALDAQGSAADQQAIPRNLRSWTDACVNRGQEKSPNNLDMRYEGWSGFFASALAQYVKDLRDEGRTVTEKMIQDQARLFAYGSFDEWNQTEADHPEWLRMFKEQLGLNLDSG